MACSWSSWSAVCVCSAEGAASAVSERRSFARSCAFRLGNRRPKAFLFAPQAKKILLFAFAKQDPTCLLVVVHYKVVSTLDKRNTKSHLIKLKSRQEGLLAIIHHPRQEERARSHDRRRHLFLRKAASNCLYIGDFFGISVVLSRFAPLFELIRQCCCHRRVVATHS